MQKNFSHTPKRFNQKSRKLETFEAVNVQIGLGLWMLNKIIN